VKFKNSGKPAEKSNNSTNKILKNIISTPMILNSLSLTNLNIASKMLPDYFPPSFV
jgi:hypothetical protein